MLTEQQAVTLLKKYSSSRKDLEKVLGHSRKVQMVALKIAKKIKNQKVDLLFVSTASLLHDIGRFECPPWKNSSRHGVEGARILRKEKLYKHARVAESHLGGGITRAEAKKIGLPVKDYAPKSVEEKIVCYADKLVAGSKLIAVSQAIRRFENEIGKKAADRIRRLHKEIQDATANKGVDEERKRG